MIVRAIDINPTSFPGAKVTSISQIIDVFLPLFMVLAAIVFLIMMLRAAFHWLTSQGSAEEIVKAQKMMTYSVFGLIVVFLSYLIVKLIGIIFNINGVI